MILLAEVIDFQRFRRPRELMAYLGLVELDAGHHCMGAGIEGLFSKRATIPPGNTLAATARKRSGRAAGGTWWTTPLR